MVGRIGFDDSSSRMTVGRWMDEGKAFAGIHEDVCDTRQRMLCPYGSSEEHRRISQAAPRELKNRIWLDAINRRLLTEPPGIKGGMEVQKPRRGADS